MDIQKRCANCTNELEDLSGACKGCLSPSEWRGKFRAKKELIKC